jgi:phosphinothricin acetyltransferase
LGAYLVKRAVAEAPTLGMNTLMGFIFAHNEPSLRLFAEHGFSRWGVLPRIAELDGVERDVVIVGRRVSND